MSRRTLAQALELLAGSLSPTLGGVAGGGVPPVIQRMRKAERRRGLGQVMAHGPVMCDDGTKGFAWTTDPLDEQFDDERAGFRRRYFLTEKVSDRDRTLRGGLPSEWPDDARIGEGTDRPGPIVGHVRDQGEREGIVGGLYSIESLAASEQDDS